MLRITINETNGAMVIKLEGRIAGPWVAELGRAWAEAAPRLSSRKLLLNLCGVTFVDKNGEEALRAIYSQTGALIVATTPSIQFLAGEIMGRTDSMELEPEHACSQ